MNFTELKKFLDEKVEEFNTSAFIDEDPICLPHKFTSIKKAKVPCNSDVGKAKAQYILKAIRGCDAALFFSHNSRF